ncbi:hypothetical protein [Acetobacter orientalis]|uniref:hypothetical protein n=1 Tax=Acetobacter orientalis TaxID=146474 RepID=UPI0039ED28C3
MELTKFGNISVAVFFVLSVIFSIYQLFRSGRYVKNSPFFAIYLILVPLFFEFLAFFSYNDSDAKLICTCVMIFLACAASLALILFSLKPSWFQARGEEDPSLLLLLNYTFTIGPLVWLNDSLVQVLKYIHIMH